MIWLLAGISSLCYRAGGMKPPFKSWMRDWLIPIPAAIAIISLQGFHLAYWWAYIVHYGLLGAALSTYWDFLFKEDNFYTHGFFIGLAILPLAVTGIPLHLIALRTAVLALSMGLLNFVVNKIRWLPGKDWIEELSRGFLVVISLKLLFL